MTRIHPITTPASDQNVKAILREIRKAFGMVPNLFKTYAHHPPLLQANWQKVKAVMFEGSLSRELKETIAVLVSKDNGSAYCVAAHTAALRSIGVTEDEISALEQGVDKTTSNGKEKALIHFVRKANREPLRITEADFQALRQAGAQDVEIIETLGVMEVFTALNKFVDSLQVEIDF